MFPFLKTFFADGGYQGPQFAKALAKVLPHLDVEIVKRLDAAGNVEESVQRCRSLHGGSHGGSSFAQAGRHSAITARYAQST
jgi:hypothetical protein